MTTEQTLTAEENVLIEQPEGEVEGEQAEPDSQEITPDPQAEKLAQLEAELAERERALAERDKALADARSREIASVRQRDMHETIASVSEYVKVIADSLGDETIKEKIAELDAQRTQAAQTEAFQQRQSELSKEIWDAAQEVGLDPNSAEGFEVVRNYWNEAARSGDLYYLERARSEAHLTVQKLLREKSAKERAELEARIEETAKTTRKQVIEENEILDVNTGPASGGGAISEQALLDRFASDEYYSMTDEEKAQAVALQKRGMQPRPLTQRS